MAAIPEQRHEFQFHIFEDREPQCLRYAGWVCRHTPDSFSEVKRPEQILGSSTPTFESTHVTEQHSVRNLVESAGLFLVGLKCSGRRHRPAADHR